MPIRLVYTNPTIRKNNPFYPYAKHWVKNLPRVFSTKNFDSARLAALALRFYEGTLFLAQLGIHSRSGTFNNSPNIWLQTALGKLCFATEETQT